MINLKSFEGFDVRSANVDGVPMFVAKDVATALGYKRTADAVTQHCKKAVKINDLHGSAKHRPTQPPEFAGLRSGSKLIPEGDVYRLIFGSQLPSAERFESWVMDDVLPSIRKDGYYIDLTRKVDSVVELRMRDKYKEFQTAISLNDANERYENSLLDQIQQLKESLELERRRNK